MSKAFEESRNCINYHHVLACIEHVALIVVDSHRYFSYDCFAGSIVQWLLEKEEMHLEVITCL